ncbi:septal ring lytic transglycosylase RlpA family protein [Billgrantia kenyensis]|uniref:Endolytic peptidoglycan transglycosylase RlpA n=1 Tax=Billgrantia kenyensis TaxID=321266 RepID=A0A7V9VYC2_9GAMM|nr:septal ring lytic transglycosylase RlpA family protein [Halomonas kenyensis]MBA2777703.1 septal ring lytic transglycosylase RlpA family protein [Halomonas kenyensis]MCG6660373.1 septal ring lytic transglycosylase RlpA family protein [Halomonas kenyensis]
MSVRSVVVAGSADSGLVRVVLVLFLSVLIAGCAGRGGGQGERVPAPSGWNGEQGLASFYADRYHGRQTASGERHDRNALTAAHRSLPFGTTVRVTRLDNGSETVVRINDRGPFVRGRVIDLSRRAAEELDMIGPGVVEVRLSPE